MKPQKQNAISLVVISVIYSILYACLRLTTSQTIYLRHIGVQLFCFFIILSPISSYVQSWDQSIPKDVLTTIILSINWWYILFLQYSNIDFEGGYFSNSG